MINGEAIRGRRYPWGIVEVDNDEHCDFMRLRQALLAYVFFPLSLFSIVLSGLWRTDEEV